MRALTTVFLLVTLGLLIGTVPAMAAGETSPGFDLAQLMRQLGAVKSSTARFTERKYLRVLKEPIEDSGTLVYVAPDRLQKDTLQPKFESLRIDAETITIEREGKTQTLKLDDYPEIWGFIDGIRATLAGDLAALDRQYLVNLAGTVDDWQLLLQPRDRKTSRILASILISGAQTHIKRISTQEGDGDRTEMIIVEADG